MILLQGQSGAARLVSVLMTGLAPWYGLMAAPGDDRWDDGFGVPGVEGGGVEVIARIGPELYIGGTFTSVGGVAATNVARWDGTNWYPVGAGLGQGAVDGVLCMVVLGNRICAAGNFGTSGDRLLMNIAEWDGKEWVGLSSGLSGRVNSLTVFKNELYAGGGFRSAGGIAATNIAKWNGMSWEPVGDGLRLSVQRDGGVDSLAADNDAVYAGGRFRLAGSIAVTNVARWDGTNWSPMAQGLRDFNGAGDENGAARALAFIGSDLIAGGSFRLAGLITTTNIAKWNGVSWEALGTGVTHHGEVNSLTFSGRRLFAGGSFLNIGGVSARTVAQWDGTNWYPLGSGLGGGAPLALGCTGTELFVGGRFTTAGGKPSTNIALYHIPHSLSVTRTQAQVQVRWPSTGTNFLLEATSDADGTNWSEVQQTPLVQDAECVVTEPADSPSKFYRLRRRPW